MTIRSTNGRGQLYGSVLDTIGNTPCIRINNLAPEGVTIYVKAEFFNPAGSVKDRLAVNILEAAEREGRLQPGQTVVEASSGNTGIGLAMACAQKGYPLVVIMADSFSIERRKLMRMLGAKVVLTPRAQKAMGMYNKAAELAEANGWFLAQQFETKANADIHEHTTAREIIADFENERLDYFVTGYGTIEVSLILSNPKEAKKALFFFICSSRATSYAHSRISSFSRWSVISLTERHPVLFYSRAPGSP